MECYKHAYCAAPATHLVNIVAEDGVRGYYLCELHYWRALGRARIKFPELIPYLDFVGRVDEQR